MDALFINCVCVIYRNLKYYFITAMFDIQNLKMLLFCISYLLGIVIWEIEPLAQYVADQTKVLPTILMYSRISSCKYRCNHGSGKSFE